MKIVAIVQARMGSSRLPGKMLLPLSGSPVVARVFERARAAKLPTEVVLATTTEPSDDVLAAWAKQNGVPVFRGSENDVLDRYYQCALVHQADTVVRLTGDCPLLDPRVIDAVIAEFQKGEWDYVSNAHPPTYPDGLDTEVFSFSALKRAWQEAVLPSEREHATPYIWKHSELFRLGNVVNDEDLSAYRLTLDTNDDFKLLENVFAELVKNPATGFDFNFTLALLNQHPEWREINAHHARNEGYAKSLREDEQKKKP